MVTYNENDIHGYKAALARWQVKNDVLLAKYRGILKRTAERISEVESMAISDARNAELEYLYAVKHFREELVSDLETPADMFLTDFETRGCR